MTAYNNGASFTWRFAYDRLLRLVSRAALAVAAWALRQRRRLRL